MSKRIALISIIFILLDQIIKIVVSNSIELNHMIEVIPNFFSLARVHNYGAAWSMLSGNVILLIIIAVIALVAIYFMFIHKKKLKVIEEVTYSLLIGGIIGNLIDRIFLGYVVDYLSFNIFGYMFPVFNLADIGIVVSVFGLIFLSIQEEIKCKRLKSKEI